MTDVTNNQRPSIYMLYTYSYLINVCKLFPINGIFEYAQSNLIIHFKWAKCLVCELDLTKAVKKKKTVSSRNGMDTTIP